MKLSILDLVPLREGQTFKEAIEDMDRLVSLAEDLGVARYWISEHHNSPALASSATALLIQRALGQTTQLRVGSGGVMLPNHSPYLVAEQYGTLETLYPGRLDLGLGRAPGTDMQTAKAIRRTDQLYPDFETDLALLEGYFKDTQAVHAYPAAGLSIPFYILGSSTDSAHLTAKLGLPYVFAAHFAPAMLEEAVAIYRREFQASASLTEPYVIVSVNVFLADTTAEAKRLATTQTQSFLGLVSSQKYGLLPPKDSEEEVWKNFVATEKVPHFGPIAFEREELIYREKAIVTQMTSGSLIGDLETVSQQLKELHQRAPFDELMANSFIYDQKAQHHSYCLLSKLVEEIELD